MWCCPPDVVGRKWSLAPYILVCVFLFFVTEAAACRLVLEYMASNFVSRSPWAPPPYPVVACVRWSTPYFFCSGRTGLCTLTESTPGTSCSLATSSRCPLMRPPCSCTRDRRQRLKVPHLPPGDIFESVKQKNVFFSTWDETVTFLIDETCRLFSRVPLLPVSGLSVWAQESGHNFGWTATN